jgi:hypothetical protein
MAPNFNIAQDDVVLSPYLVGTDDHDDHLGSLGSPPSSPISVCDTANSKSDNNSNNITADRTNVTTRDISVSPFKDKAKRRNRIVGKKPIFPPSLEETKTQRTVKFHSRVRFKHIKHIDDYSDREYFATWYVEEDLQEIFDHCVDTVRKMVHGEILAEKNGYCPRGLEYKTPTGAKTRKQNKSKGIRIVLEEQERQRAEGINDPERLAKLYYKSAVDSRRAYRLLAMQDQEEARPILQSKSSVMVLREKFQQQQKLKQRTDNNEKLHESATSVLDEFQQSYQPSTEDENDDSASVDVCEYRVTFGPVEVTGDGEAC